MTDSWLATGAFAVLVGLAIYCAVHFLIHQMRGGRVPALLLAAAFVLSKVLGAFTAVMVL